ncbi:amino acid permease [Mycolicibacterium murale]|jgi:amino acid transporter|uniref:Amino acid permease n=1 Tax=Mycolicibacterium murale TaxID=182220 RepID=A0A7I9WG01_9MYCO|nr:APC family permease [Mycolicibacterium murale]MCV7182908.1 APC family permease [Mycolicibacterium murale]GFG56459.1 amino acid permease [Mycolicibacterium murale]
MSLPTPDAAPHQSASTTGPAQFRANMGPIKVSLLVVACAAPLGSMIGNTPIGFTLGNGAGLPIIFLVAGLVLGCFAAGYVAINRAVPGGGGFARYVHAGFGPGAGLGAAYATTLAYGSGTIAITTAAGYFVDVIALDYGVDLPWWVYSVAALLIVGLLGRHAADLSAKVLLILIFAEFAMLVILDILILAHSGLAALPLDIFAPEQVFSGSIGPALMIAFTSFIGIESAVIYANEARNPGKTVPRAIYLCVGVISAFYFFTVWLIVGSVGVNQIVPTTEETQGDLLFVLSGEQGGDWLTALMQIFFCTSLLASLVALHNATTRYLQTMGSQGTMPKALGALHPRYQGPARASEAMSILTAVLLVVFVVVGADPYLGIYTSLGGLFTVGIVAMQGVVAVTVVVFFRRRKDGHVWKTLVAPAIGALGLLTATGLIIANYSVLTGTEDVIPNLLPFLIPLAFVAGFMVHRMRRDAVVDFDPAPAPSVQR